MAVELSEKARAFLREKRFAVLGTINNDGAPQLTTMWYILEDDDTILMNTRAGRKKDRNMRRDRRISICISDGYSYITLSGQVEIIDDPNIAQHDIYRLAVRYHGEETGKRQSVEKFSNEQRVTLHLKPNRIEEYF